MASLTLPFGELPNVTPSDVLRTNREPFYTVDIVGGAPLEGVQSVSLTYTLNARIRGRGTIVVADVGQEVDWESVRLAPRYHLNGDTSWPLSRFTCKTPREVRGAAGRVWEIEVLDLNSALERRKMAASYSVAAGAVATAELRALLTLAGETDAEITDSTATLLVSHTWPAGADYLTIANVLCDALNYTSLAVNMDGRFEASPHVLASKRSPVSEFIDGATSIHKSSFTIERNLSDIPDQVIALGRGDGETEGLVGYAPDAGSYAYTEVVELDTTSQAALDAFAARSLAARAGAPRVGTIEHLPVPLSPGDVVRFRSESFDPPIDGKFVVIETSMPDKATGLASTSLREVLG